MAFKAEQPRGAVNRLVAERAGGQPQPAEQVILAGRADDDVDPAGGALVGGQCDARCLVDDVLGGPVKLVERRDARRERDHPRPRVGPPEPCWAPPGDPGREAA